jgi:SPP1 gp7 family putative phage head morphogenesis protein
MIKGILDFMQVNIGFGFDVQAKQALKYFESKGLKPSFSFADVTAQEHATAFTVAKMMDMDLLKDVQDSLYAAMTEGLSYQQWSERIIPTLQANGWWGRQPVYDPLTGKTVVSELGSSRRLQTIFRTNMQSAYAVGHWQQIMAQAKDAPYLLYDAIDDFRTRPKHRAWDNTVLPITDPFWTAHTPPNGWGCRCSVIQLSADDLDAMGLTVSDSPKIKYVPWKNPRTGKVERTPEGVDAGFGFNAGQARYEQLQKLAGEKVAAIENKELRQAAEQSLASITVEKKINESLATAERLVKELGERDGVEYAIAVDMDTGDMLFKHKGAKERIDFTIEETRLITDTKNVVVYHNHDNGISLSVTDLVLSSERKTKVVAVATKGRGNYSAVADPKYKKEDLRVFEEKTDSYILSVLVPMVKQSKVLTGYEAQALHVHIANSIFAKLGIISYEVSDFDDTTSAALGKLGAGEFEAIVSGFGL